MINEPTVAAEFKVREAGVNRAVPGADFHRLKAFCV
jgi:hypothetical protein